MAAHVHCCNVSFWLYLIIIVLLVLFAGLMSGLTLALMSLELLDLEVLLKSGTPQDQKHAAKILPVVKNQHLLLCTLLIGNALAMEALPIFLDALVSSVGAILISVTLILMFGEILPQSVCSRYGLAVGARMVPIVRVLVFLFFPITYPISKILDFLLGKAHVALFRRAELKTLVDMHGNEAGKGGELTHDETTIIVGALKLTEKTAKDAMNPISSTFAIDVNSKLDMETMNLIMTNGHSRVPVYLGTPMNIIGTILVKVLLTIRPEDEIPVKNVTIRKIPRVGENMPLYEILNEFRKGHSHMAAVVKYSKGKMDMVDRSRDLKGQLEMVLSTRHSSEGKIISGKTAHKDAALNNPKDENMQNMPKSGNFAMLKMNTPSGAGSPAFKKGGAGNVEEILLTTRGKKWERTSLKDILDMSEESLSSFPQDEEIIGIITMEDVIEELLQTEVLDETDEYIDVHNRLKVNMLPVEGRSLISPRSPSYPTTASSQCSSLQYACTMKPPPSLLWYTPMPKSYFSPQLHVSRTTPTIAYSRSMSVPISQPTVLLATSSESLENTNTKYTMSKLLATFKYKEEYL